MKPNDWTAAETKLIEPLRAHPALAEALAGGFGGEAGWG